MKKKLKMFIHLDKLLCCFLQKIIEKNFKPNQEVREVSLEDHVLEYLYPEEDDFLFTGRLATQGPGGIDGQVILEECDAPVGEIIPVHITGSADYDLIARPVD